MEPGAPRVKMQDLKGFLVCGCQPPPLFEKPPPQVFLMLTPAPTSRCLSASSHPQGAGDVLIIFLPLLRRLADPTHL